MIQISRQFQDLARSSPGLLCRRELFAAGLIENPHNPCDPDEHRRLCKEYVRKWSDPTNIAESLREVSLEHSLSSWNDMIFAGRDLLVMHARQSETIDFLHIPSATSQNLTERWSIPQFPFEVLRYVTYPPENVLAVAEKKDG